MNQLESFRANFARLIAVVAGLPAEATPISEAFASVPREQFIGPAPWQIVTRKGYVTITDDDPTFLYQDYAIGLKPEKRINNGQPSLHAYCLAALQIKPGETVVHVGAGTGYYSAILAKLTGPGGPVIAYELEKDLADRATANLATYANVSVQNRSGVEGPLPECDVVYVNAGATAPMAAWLDCLRAGGRLLFPLTAANGYGAMLLVTKSAEGGFAAKFISPAAFVACLGARDTGLEEKLAEAFKKGGLMHPLRKGQIWEVQSLRRNIEPDDTCWFAAPGWWLSTAAAS